MADRFNVLTGELPVQQDQSGYAWHGRRGVAREQGLRWLGASVYELPEGQWTFPYHYHHGVEEWVYVVAGAPTLRDPTGERVLAPGDLVCFPSGPDGAHAVRGPGRVVMFSGWRQPGRPRCPCTRTPTSSACGPPAAAQIGSTSAAATRSTTGMANERDTSARSQRNDG